MTTTLNKSARKKTSKSSKSTDPNDPFVYLKSLYPPAARAFLRRDISLTQSLVERAFITLSAHPVSSFLPDSFDSHRRKWDLLRITLETTLYSSPPTISTTPEHSHTETDGLPPSLKDMLLQSPSHILDTMYVRSVQLFMPMKTPDGPSPIPLCLPAQILVALVYSALKLECPEVGRKFAEDWLAHRGLAPIDLHLSPSNGNTGAESPDAYERVIDVYCLQVLPRLGEWEYAFEFLKYEQELPEEKKKVSCHLNVRDPVHL
ncbi:uncharacterized protein EI90DRAFT_2907682 [Cantharellus anzutake]|uniref:uncharacterized protein n=1 Tax=Cantharellus anzutake TaxID=1750568 RepID=UPI001907ED91|nr:uncharacterized protein EI90DRAFT_2907682 [Cantharellus anzutake]KAF8340000.1 hypothetical protein EI90DRAFT_2907682 [Cantharellus anzutake]